MGQTVVNGMGAWRMEYRETARSRAVRTIVRFYRVGSTRDEVAADMARVLRENLNHDESVVLSLESACVVEAAIERDRELFGDFGDPDALAEYRAELGRQRACMVQRGWAWVPRTGYAALRSTDDVRRSREIDRAQ